MSERDRPMPKDEEVTPEMVEAGVIALEEFSESYGQAELATEVYNAMRRARKGSSRNSAKDASTFCAAS